MKTRNINVRKILIGLLVTAATVLNYGQELKIAIKNVKGEAGNVRVALYNSSDQFLKKEIKLMEIKSADGELNVVFEDVPPGTYAISVIHDANGNQKLDSNFMGMPKEGFGFSNDAIGMFGPPDFKKASYEYSVQKELVITMKYL